MHRALQAHFMHTQSRTISRTLAACCCCALLAHSAAAQQPPRPKLFTPGPATKPSRDAAPRTVSLERVREGLDELKELLAARHAYSVIAPVPDAAFEEALAHATRIATLRAEQSTDGASITHDELGEVLALVLAQSIDGHGSIGAGRFPRIGPALPVVLEPWEDASRAGETPLIVLNADRTPLVAASPTHTLLLAMDGVSTADWLQSARRFVPKGTKQLQDRWASGLLLSMPLVRRWRDIPAPHDLPVLLKLGDSAGKLPPIEIELPLRNVPDSPLPWPARPSGMLDDNIAYLRLPAMIGDTKGLRDVRRMLDSFAPLPGAKVQAKALIIDLRNNGGGARDLIPLLADALLPAGQGPIVFTASRVLKLKNETELQQKERTENRDIYTRDDIRWNAAQRAAIDAFVEQYKPAVAVPDDRFAPLHFGLLTPASPGTSTGNSPVITGPIVVLMNGGCFSAADVCLAALAEFPNVTLMGQPSAGGSGYAEHVQFMQGFAWARLSTMATFRKDGSLFDGVGITPDVLVAPAATDFVAGGTDSMLEAAKTYLRERM